MTDKIYLKDAISYYFQNLQKNGKINKSTVIGAAILNVAMCEMNNINPKYHLKRGNLLDKNVVILKFHTKVNLSEQQLISISYLIERVFLKELRDFAELYKELSELSYKEIVSVFFKKNNIPTNECLYDEVFYESYLKVLRWKNRNNKLGIIDTDLNFC